MLSSRLLLTRVLPHQTLPYTIALLERGRPSAGSTAGRARRRHPPAARRVAGGLEGGGRAGGGRAGLLADAMRAVGDAWSGGVHTSGTSLAQQRYVSAALVLGLGRLPVQLVSEELMPTLLQGVQHHLQSPSPPVRRLGMDVAEALSRLERSASASGE